MNTIQAVQKRIIDLCKLHTITPNGLSYQSGVSQSTIKSILSKNAKDTGVVTIKKLCDGFGITLSDFFDTETFRALEQEIK